MQKKKIRNGYRELGNEYKLRKRVKINYKQELKITDDIESWDGKDW